MSYNINKNHKSVSFLNYEDREFIPELVRRIQA